MIRFRDLELMFAVERVMNGMARKEQIMVEKDYKLYGTKILNLKTQKIGLLICLWENKYADKTVDFATCVDKNGKR